MYKTKKRSNIETNQPMKSKQMFILAILGMGALLMLPAGAAAAPTPTPIPAGPTLIPTAANWDHEPTATPTPSWEDHFTLVLLGTDTRPGGGSLNTDAIMIVDFNPSRSTAGVYSIPRDVWFYTGVVGEPLRQVNIFYPLGELDPDTTGGEAIQDMLRLNLGLEIDGYLVLDFYAFTHFINAIGGVEVAVSKTIDDPTYPDMSYGYDPLYIPAGVVYMDGETALKYIRTRHGDSDYGRMRRQQNLLQAIWQKLTTPGVWDRFIANAPRLWLEARHRIDTNLDIDQLIDLIQQAQDISTEAVQFGICTGEDVVAPQKVNNMRDVLVILPEGASAHIRKIFSMD